jgi:hypothetical protein
MQLMVLSEMYGLAVVVLAVGKGKVRGKFFGDDVLLALFREMFPFFDGERYRDLFNKMFNMTIKKENFKICSKVSLGMIKSYDQKEALPEDQDDVPSFLKFKIAWWKCSICNSNGVSCMHPVFFRPSWHVLPKLFVDSIKTLTLENLAIKCIGYAYTVGTNPVIHRAVSYAYQLAKAKLEEEKNHKIDDFNINLNGDPTMDDDIQARMRKHSITGIVEGIPNWKYVLQISGCPETQHGQISISRDFYHWHDLANLRNEKAYTQSY